MKLRAILLISTLLLVPILSIAQTPNSRVDSEKLEVMDIKDLIEKAKEAPAEERVKIENQIKKRIAQAHRKKPFQ